ncbi:hypothetical protein AWZ03_006559 [Drosophila navojoa]|uniref:Uncharacterized protein n=1 Tax=Drosophila navojoa TaxID=7232 RepID=A0A484BE25_DRONA|nr:hypothetical protein AWZ03_006559 [Drosophila navojoa]
MFVAAEPVFTAERDDSRPEGAGLEMLTANMHLVNTIECIVYPLNIFEVHANAQMTFTKIVLKRQLATGEAIAKGS